MHDLSPHDLSPHDLALHASFTEAGRFLTAGPAVLRLRMLELEHGMRNRTIPEPMQAHTRAAIAQLRRAILLRPDLSFADAVAKTRTLGGPAADAVARSGMPDA